MITGREELLDAMIEAYIMEKGTVVFYELAVSKATDPGAVETFQRLSRSEKEHMRYIGFLYNSIEDNRDLIPFEEFRTKTVPTETEGGVPVSELTDRMEDIPAGDDLAIVAEAEAIEKKAYTLYKTLSEAARDANARVFMRDLMGWELKHMEYLRKLRDSLAGNK